MKGGWEEIRVRGEWERRCWWWGLGWGVFWYFRNFRFRRFYWKRGWGLSEK